MDIAEAPRKWSAEHERKLKAAIREGSMIVECNNDRTLTIASGPENAEADGRESSRGRRRAPIPWQLRNGLRSIEGDDEDPLSPP